MEGNGRVVLPCVKHHEEFLAFVASGDNVDFA